MGNRGYDLTRCSYFIGVYINLLFNLQKQVEFGKETWREGCFYL